MYPISRGPYIYWSVGMGLFIVDAQIIWNGVLRGIKLARGPSTRGGDYQLESKHLRADLGAERHLGSNMPSSVCPEILKYWHLNEK